MTKSSTWNGCYNGSLKDLIVPEAFKHPAKMSRLLCQRIFDHGKQKGYWSPGDLIIDPFGGIGTTGLIGAYRGYQVISIELEKEFYDLALQNRDKNLPKINKLSHPRPIFINADSRKILDILGEEAGCVTSPPFLASKGGAGGINKKGYGENSQDKVGERTYQAANGNRDDKNVEILPEGNHGLVVGGITSPPYGSEITKNRSGHLETDRLASKGKDDQSYGRMRDGLPMEEYGDSEGQIGAMPTGAITSPPWEDSLSNEIDQHTRKELAVAAGISNSADQPPIPPSGAITSPPYENSVNSFRSGIDWDKAGRPERNNPSDSRQAVQAAGLAFNYGQTQGQIGAQSGDTYWSAVALIYQQIFHLLPPGGAFALVVKDFVRKKKRVPLCDQTAELLQAIGFEIPERILAMLVKEIPQTIDMFTGDSTPRLVERKSFFRRLAEKKGSPRIDWEEVIWAVKP